MSDGEWTAEALAKRRANVTGTVTFVYEDHLDFTCTVRHDDGTEAEYDHWELTGI